MGTNDVVYGEFEYVGELPVVPAARLVTADRPVDEPVTVAPASGGPLGGSRLSSLLTGNPIDQARELAERAVHAARDVASAVTLQPVPLPFGLGQVPVPSVDTSRLELETATVERARQELGALAQTARGHLATFADDARRSAESTARTIRDAVRV